MAGFKSTESYIASRDLEVAVNAAVLNVLNAMRLFEDPTPWGDRLIAGCASE